EDYDSLVVKGYRISNEVAVTVREVDNVSALVSATLKAGANTVNNVEFYTSELRKYRDQARDLAVKASKEKAQALAAAAGAETGCVISITENSWASYSGWWGGRNQSAWSQNVVQNVAGAEGYDSTGEEPISLGMIAVRAEVSATYSLD
ncbi:MAG: SIMPL domain-containing protein, partial [Anaerolineae bacterium]